MRWQSKQHHSPAVGQQRTKSAWLWWPKCINDEYKWLETAHWIEEYVEGIDFSPGCIRCMDCISYPPMPTCVYWRAKEWYDPAIGRPVRNSQGEIVAHCKP